MGSSRNASKSAPPPAAAPIARVLVATESLGCARHWCSASASSAIWRGNITCRRSRSIRSTRSQPNTSTSRPLPAWIRADVKAEVLRDSGLIGKLSVIEDQQQLQKRVRDAFAFHPWVAEVGAIRSTCLRRSTSSSNTAGRWRRSRRSTKPQFRILPVDAHGVRLPETDFSDYERRSLPRISGVAGVPSVGERWATSG